MNLASLRIYTGHHVLDRTVFAGCIQGLEIVVATLKALGLEYPKVSAEQVAALQKAKEGLINEK